VKRLDVRGTVLLYGTLKFPVTSNGIIAGRTSSPNSRPRRCSFPQRTSKRNKSANAPCSVCLYDSRSLLTSSWENVLTRLPPPGIVSRPCRGPSVTVYCTSAGSHLEHVTFNERVLTILTLKEQRTTIQQYGDRYTGR